VLLRDPRAFRNTSRLIGEGWTQKDISWMEKRVHPRAWEGWPV
jgi:hypothetical protein